jgi:hypothetical protein
MKRFMARLLNEDVGNPKKPKEIAAFNYVRATY